MKKKPARKTKAVKAKSYHVSETRTYKPVTAHKTAMTKRGNPAIKPAHVVFLILIIIVVAVVVGVLLTAPRHTGTYIAGQFGMIDKIPEKCGNGMLDTGEQCDPPGSSPAQCGGYACTRYCKC